MQPKVSVIVPIYNVEQYLEECVNSLINQSLKNIEIILVDDGSPDNSGMIADRFAKKDARIKVIHQSNGGLGPARNSGMDAATGEYVGFVDSDDWVKPDMYAKLYNTASTQMADVIVSGHCNMVNGIAVEKKIHPLAGRTLSRSDEILRVRNKLYGHSPEETEIEAFPMSVCMSLYKKSMLVKHHLRFKKILSEDTIFNLSAYRYANVITFTEFTDYCYRKEGQASITQSFSNSKLNVYQDFLSTLINMAKLEDDERCLNRARRTAIDYCRLYVGIIDNTKDSIIVKRNNVKKLANNELIRKCWEGYPVNTLPIQQRIFHYCIEGKMYLLALFMNRIRKKMKKKYYNEIKKK